MNGLGRLIFFLGLLSGYAQQSHTIDSGDSKLYYRTFGKGQPILIINGGPGMNSEGFAQLAATISGFGNRAIIYDQRGTGKSTLPIINTTTINLREMAQDIENLRKHLKIEKWTILGHSFGGIMATYYAARYPQRIEKLIFSSSAGVDMGFMQEVGQRLNSNLTPQEIDSLNHYQNRLSQGDDSPKTTNLRAQYLASAYVHDKSKIPIIAQRLTQTNHQVNQLVFDDLLKINFDCSQSFKDFKPKVLVLQGKNDIISVNTAQKIVKAFPNATLVVMDNCGHYGWLDAPALYFQSIEAFLKNQT